MEANIITTYRCNARCGMCEIWKYPTSPSEEFDPEILRKLPTGIKRLNITGGDPTLRQDLPRIVEILSTKTDHLEISTNGYLTDVLDKITLKHPELCIRISIEGLPEVNDRLRGLKNGFDHALRTFLKLRANRVTNLGFAMTISGENVRDLLDVYNMCVQMDCQLANAVVHNSFYFHKSDNTIANKQEAEETMKQFITALLTSSRRSFRGRIKDWFRAYINLGLLHHIKGVKRTLPCGAASESFFIDPHGFMLACNGSDEPMIMGDLNTQEFDEIWNSEQADQVRKQVVSCRKNCWMTGTAVPAMRKHPVDPVKWVISSKLKMLHGETPDFRLQDE
ncbi:MAG: radical SAM protein [Candidatus Thorarchaeota archaeon]